MSETLVWQMGKIRVFHSHRRMIIRKINSLGNVIWESDWYSGFDAKKRAVAAAKKLYEKE